MRRIRYERPAVRKALDEASHAQDKILQRPPDGQGAGRARSAGERTEERRRLGNLGAKRDPRTARAIGCRRLRDPSIRIDHVRRVSAEIDSMLVSWLGGGASPHFHPK